MTDRRAHPDRSFRISREARERFVIEAPLAGLSGHVVATDRVAIRRLAARVQALRPAGDPPAQAGELAALALMHEIFHLVVAKYDEDCHPGAMEAAAARLHERLAAGAPLVLSAFAAEFPAWEPAPEPAGETVEELILARVANENPAAAPLRELFDDRPLAAAVPYAAAVAELDAYFAAAPPFGPANETLVELLRAPARHSPTSLTGQLRYIRERWAPLLGEALSRILGEIDLALGVLEEEERALHLRFGGFTGGFGGRVDLPSFAGLDHEVERFSSDSEWMPRLVLLAKSTYVWLDQLSRRYRREIRTLDAIPDEELDRIARWGVTGLWLIGLWQRSIASETIKRWRGNSDAVASAYSLDDYRIADDLGGESAYANLRDRAWRRGIRLASDMVPNHMGIDSRWVVEHPDWFLSLPEPPYPAYTFNGADLSHDERVGIVLEDHYWDDSDAAVVFKRFDRWTGDTRYVYHGNDGTSFPWNDTAQLDFLNPEVREAVIQAILGVARRFPIIRFDAAMVLAKKHIQRLWWPEPGTGGGIPSRAEHAMAREEFDRRMPVEFWREVVDRVAAEVPDTLLLAEAFWLLEGYFVRTLGMHRVYNSAFMHMLRDENNAGYRTLIKETLEFDPGILKRYVNFMNNPDEATAADQFGKGDKYFGVAMVLATMPGLPMVGHGQVEGFSEKYGMEFRRARLDEQPDPWLVERHEREIFPLFHRRGEFAEADTFRLFDFWSEHGAVDENVIAYANGHGPSRSLVVYHNRFAATAGTLRESAAFAVKQPDGAKLLARVTLAEALGLSHDPGSMLTFRDARSGLEFIRRTREIVDHGLFLSLQAYEGHVFWEFRELPDPSGVWSRLCHHLGGRGVPSLQDALRELELQPLHGVLRALFRDGLAPLLALAPPAEAAWAAFRERYAAYLEAIAAVTGVGGDVAPVTAAVAREIEALLAPVGPAAALDGSDRAALVVRTLMAAPGRLAPAPEAERTSLAWYDELRLMPVVAEGFRATGCDEGQAWTAAQLVRTLVALPRPGRLGGPAATLPGRLLAALLERDDLRPQMGLNVWEGSEWVEAGRFGALLDWAAILDALEPAPPPTSTTSPAAAPPVAAPTAPSVGAPPTTTDTTAPSAPAGTVAPAVPTVAPPLAPACEQLKAAAKAAGYRVDALRAALESPTSATPRPTAPAPTAPPPARPAGTPPAPTKATHPPSEPRP